MADDPKDRRSDGQPADPQSASGATSTASKRPYATLDLKATEIKITPVPDNSQSYASAATRGYAMPKTDKFEAEKTPRPAPPSAYGSDKPVAPTSTYIRTEKVSDMKSAAAATAAKPAASALLPKSEPVVVQKRGGFFSHLTAGLIGGALALAGSEWALPQLGIDGSTSRLADDTAALGQRLQALEKKPVAAEAQKPDAQLEERLAALEKTTQKIPGLAESQSRLVAETKAALASSAGESVAPEQLTRIAALEEKLKALTDAGANDPNAGRLAQLAALTGKVADLETSLATQLTALRKGVSDDVDARIASVSASTEAAKSGTQRIDKDVASVKSEAVLITERLQGLKTDNDRLSATLKMAQDETTALKSQVEVLRTSSAKPTDVTAAVTPIGDKLASLEQSVQRLTKEEGERRVSSERVLLSLELQNLKRALDGGQKYAAELSAVQKSAGGKFDLAALDKFKDQGVPVATELAREFRTVATSAIDADSEAAEGGVVDRLIAGAKAVVRVRKVDHTPDDKSAEAVVGRMEMAFKESRLSDVLGESKQLSPKALAAVQPFLDRVAARVSIDTAVGSIETQLKQSLGSALEANPVPEIQPKATP
jgi:hypothetical protein